MVRRRRCAWCGNDPLMVRYHDQEWGVPVHDDGLLFEFLLLEGMQAGLSWATILRKRDNFRRAFDGFSPRRISRYNSSKLHALLRDPGIIRNRLKVRAAVSNARAFLAVQKEFDTFDRYIWRFAGGRPLARAQRAQRGLPSRIPESDMMSADLKRRGFTFVGSTICYAFMQAVGMVNDHTHDCFRHRQLARRHHHHSSVLASGPRLKSHRPEPPA